MISASVTASLYLKTCEAGGRCLRDTRLLQDAFPTAAESSG